MGDILAKKTKNKKLKKQIKDAFILTLIICMGMLIVYTIIRLIASPTESFMITDSKISSEESKVRLCY